MALQVGETAVSAEDPRISQSEEASRQLLHRLRKLNGAIQLAVVSDPARGGSILVAVPSLWSQVTDQVHEIHGEVLRHFPAARLDVDVQGLQELGDPESWAATLPAGATVLL